MKNTFLDACNQTLEAGRQRFGAMLGVVSRTRDGLYEVVAVSSQTAIPLVGDTYDASAVYCREVLARKQTVAITEIDGIPGMHLHPLYDTIPCEFYISSPILVDHEVWGTLNFTSLAKRDAPFSDEDIRFNERHAAHLGRLLTTMTTSAATR